MNIKKIISIITCGCFIFTFVLSQPLHASLEKSKEVSRFKKIFEELTIPPTYGRVTESYLASRESYLGIEENEIRDTSGASRDTVVINIQDLHCHPEVQKNISKIIEILDAKYDLKHVYVEGAYGPIDSSWLTRVSNKELKKKIYDSLIESGKLTGPEYYSLKSEKTDLLIGVDNKKLHTENVLRLNSILRKQKEFKSIISDLQDDLNILMHRYYCSENKILDKLVQKNKEGKLDPRKFYKKLLKKAEKLDIDAGYYQNVIEYTNAFASAKNLDIKKVGKELQGFISTLKKNLPYDAYSMLLNNTANFTQVNKLYVLLGRIADEYPRLVEGYPNLSIFFRQQKLNQEINPLQLIKEEQKLLNEIRLRSACGENERDVIFLIEFTRYLEDYLAYKISADDCEYIGKNLPRFKMLWALYVGNDKLDAISGDIEILDDYYCVNIKRNSCMLSNCMINKEFRIQESEVRKDEEKDKPLNSESWLLNSNNESSQEHKVTSEDLLENAGEIIVLVTGGFHTPGLVEIMKERNIPYIVITPNVTQDTNFAEVEYKRILKKHSEVISKYINPQKQFSLDLEMQDGFIGSLEAMEIRKFLASSQYYEVTNIDQVTGIIDELFGGDTGIKLLNSFSADAISQALNEVFSAELFGNKVGRIEFVQTAEGEYTILVVYGEETVPLNYVQDAESKTLSRVVDSEDEIAIADDEAADDPSGRKMSASNRLGFVLMHLVTVVTAIFVNLVVLVLISLVFENFSLPLNNFLGYIVIALPIIPAFADFIQIVRKQESSELPLIPDNDILIELEHFLLQQEISDVKVTLGNPKEMRFITDTVREGKDVVINASLIGKFHGNNRRMIYAHIADHVKFQQKNYELPKSLWFVEEYLISLKNYVFDFPTMIIESFTQTVINSIAEVVTDLPRRIIKTMKPYMDSEQLDASMRLMEIMKDMHGAAGMNILTRVYHSFAHALMVAYACVLLVSRSSWCKPEDVRLAFLAGFFHDLHFREVENAFTRKTGRNRPAFVPITIQQLNAMRGQEDPFIVVKKSELFLRKYKDLEKDPQLKDLFDVIKASIDADPADVTQREKSMELLDAGFEKVVDITGIFTKAEEMLSSFYDLKEARRRSRVDPQQYEKVKQGTRDLVEDIRRNPDLMSNSVLERMVENIEKALDEADSQDYRYLEGRLVELRDISEPLMYSLDAINQMYGLMTELQDRLQYYHYMADGRREEIIDLIYKIAGINKEQFGAEHNLEGVFKEIEVIIRKTDFPSDVKRFLITPNTNILVSKIRSKLDNLASESGSITVDDLESMIEEIDNRAQEIQGIVRKDLALIDRGERSDLITTLHTDPNPDLRKQLSIYTEKAILQYLLEAELRILSLTRNYLEAMQRIDGDTKRRAILHRMAIITEKGADQSAGTWLLSPETYEHELVPALQTEIGKAQANVPGNYPYFFLPMLLNDSTTMLVTKLLPTPFKRNFMKLMEHFSKAAGVTKEGESWYRNWERRKESVAYQLEMGRTAVKSQFTIGGTEEVDLYDIVSQLLLTRMGIRRPLASKHKHSVSGTIVKVPAGVPFIEEGDMGYSMYIILDGEVDITGKQLNKNVGGFTTIRKGTGNMVGEFGLLAANRRRSARVCAGENGATLLRIDYRDMMRAMEEDPQLASMLSLHYIFALSNQDYMQDYLERLKNEESKKRISATKYELILYELAAEDSKDALTVTDRSNGQLLAETTLQNVEKEMYGSHQHNLPIDNRLVEFAEKRFGYKIEPETLEVIDELLKRNRYIVQMLKDLHPDIESILFILYKLAVIYQADESMLQFGETRETDALNYLAQILLNSKIQKRSIDRELRGIRFALKHNQYGFSNHKHVSAEFLGPVSAVFRAAVRGDKYFELSVDHNPAIGTVFMPDELTDGMIGTMRHAIKKSKTEVTIRGPSYYNEPGFAYNSDMVVMYYKQTIDMAKTIGASNVIVNFSHKGDIEDFLEIIDYAIKNKVEVTIENGIIRGEGRYHEAGEFVDLLNATIAGLAARDISPKKIRKYLTVAVNTANFARSMPIGYGENIEDWTKDQLEDVFAWAKRMNIRIQTAVLSNMDDKGEEVPIFNEVDGVVPNRDFMQMLLENIPMDLEKMRVIVEAKNEMRDSDRDWLEENVNAVKRTSILNSTLRVPKIFKLIMSPLLDKITDKPEPQALGFNVRNVVEGLLRGSINACLFTVGDMFLEDVSIQIAEEIEAALLSQTADEIQHVQGNKYKKREQDLERLLSQVYDGQARAPTGKIEVSTCKGKLLKVSDKVYRFATLLTDANNNPIRLIVTEGFWDEFNNDEEKRLVIIHELNELKARSGQNVRFNAYLRDKGIKARAQDLPSDDFIEHYHTFLKEENTPDAAVVRKAEDYLLKFTLPADIAARINFVIKENLPNILPYIGEITRLSDLIVSPLSEERLPPLPSNITINELLDIANSAIVHSDYEVAERILRSLLQRPLGSNDEVVIKSKLARVLATIGQYREARGYFEELLSHTTLPSDIDQGQLHYYYALVLLNESASGSRDDQINASILAERQFTAALEYIDDNNPLSYIIHSKRANIYLFMEEWELAFNDYTEASDIWRRQNRVNSLKEEIRYWISNPDSFEKVDQAFILEVINGTVESIIMLAHGNEKYPDDTFLSMHRYAEDGLRLLDIATKLSEQRWLQQEGVLCRNSGLALTYFAEAILRDDTKSYMSLYLAIERMERGIEIAEELGYIGISLYEELEQAYNLSQKPAAFRLDEEERERKAKVRDIELKKIDLQGKLAVSAASYFNEEPNVWTQDNNLRLELQFSELTRQDGIIGLFLINSFELLIVEAGQDVEAIKIIYPYLKELVKQLEKIQKRLYSDPRSPQNPVLDNILNQARSALEKSNDVLSAAYTDYLERIPVEGKGPVFLPPRIIQRLLDVVLRIVSVGKFSFSQLPRAIRNAVTAVDEIVFAPVLELGMFSQFLESYAEYISVDSIDADVFEDKKEALDNTIFELGIRHGYARFNEFTGKYEWLVDEDRVNWFYEGLVDYITRNALTYTGLYMSMEVAGRLDTIKYAYYWAMARLSTVIPHIKFNIENRKKPPEKRTPLTSIEDLNREAYEHEYEALISGAEKLRDDLVASIERIKAGGANTQEELETLLSSKDALAIQAKALENTATSLGLKYMRDLIAHITGNKLALFDVGITICLDSHNIEQDVDLFMTRIVDELDVYISILKDKAKAHLSGMDMTRPLSNKESTKLNEIKKVKPYSAYEVRRASKIGTAIGAAVLGIGSIATFFTGFGIVVSIIGLAIASVFIVYRGITSVNEMFKPEFSLASLVPESNGKVSIEELDEVSADEIDEAWVAGKLSAALGISKVQVMELFNFIALTRKIKLLKEREEKNNMQGTLKRFSIADENYLPPNWIAQTTSDSTEITLVSYMTAGIAHSTARFRILRALLLPIVINHEWLRVLGRNDAALHLISNPLYIFAMPFIEISSLFVENKSATLGRVWRKETRKNRLIVLAPDKLSGDDFAAEVKKDGIFADIEYIDIPPRVVKSPGATYADQLSDNPAVARELAYSIMNQYEKGYKVMAIACNTLHHWLPEAMAYLPSNVREDITILNTIETTKEFISAEAQDSEMPVWLGTSPLTRQSNIVKDSFPTLDSLGYDNLQDIAQQIIWQVKALEGLSGAERGVQEDHIKVITGVFVSKLREAGINNVVMGCTELPIAFKLVSEIEDLSDFTLHDPAFYVVSKTRISGFDKRSSVVNSIREFLSILKTIFNELIDLPKDFYKIRTSQKKDERQIIEIMQEVLLKEKAVAGPQSKEVIVSCESYMLRQIESIGGQLVDIPGEDNLVYRLPNGMELIVHKQDGVNPSENLILELRASEQGPVMVYNGHVDVIDDGSESKKDWKGRTIYDRGVADMNGANASAMQAFLRLCQAQPNAFQGSRFLTLTWIEEIAREREQGTQAVFNYLNGLNRDIDLVVIGESSQTAFNRLNTLQLIQDDWLIESNRRALEMAQASFSLLRDSLLMSERERISVLIPESRRALEVLKKAELLTEYSANIGLFSRVIADAENLLDELTRLRLDKGNFSEKLAKAEEVAFAFSLSTAERGKFTAYVRPQNQLASESNITQVVETAKTAYQIYEQLSRKQTEKGHVMEGTSLTLSFRSRGEEKHTYNKTPGFAGFTFRSASAQSQDVLQGLQKLVQTQCLSFLGVVNQKPDVIAVNIRDDGEIAVEIRGEEGHAGFGATRGINAHILAGWLMANLEEAFSDAQITDTTLLPYMQIDCRFACEDAGTIKDEIEGIVNKQMFEFGQQGGEERDYTGPLDYNTQDANDILDSASQSTGLLMSPRNTFFAGSDAKFLNAAMPIGQKVKAVAILGLGAFRTLHTTDEHILRGNLLPLSRMYENIFLADSRNILSRSDVLNEFKKLLSLLKHNGEQVKVLVEEVDRALAEDYDIENPNVKTRLERISKLFEEILSASVTLMNHSFDAGLVSLYKELGHYSGNRVSMPKSRLDFSIRRDRSDLWESIKDELIKNLDSYEEVLDRLGSEEFEEEWETGDIEQISDILTKSNNQPLLAENRVSLQELIDFGDLVQKQYPWYNPVYVISHRSSKTGEMTYTVISPDTAEAERALNQGHTVSVLFETALVEEGEAGSIKGFNGRSMVYPVLVDGSIQFVKYLGIGITPSYEDRDAGSDNFAIGEEVSGFVSQDENDVRVRVAEILGSAPETSPASQAYVPEIDSSNPIHLLWSAIHHREVSLDELRGLSEDQLRDLYGAKVSGKVNDDWKTAVQIKYKPQRLGDVLTIGDISDMPKAMRVKAISMILEQDGIKVQPVAGQEHEETVIQAYLDYITENFGKQLAFWHGQGLAHAMISFHNITARGNLCDLATAGTIVPRPEETIPQLRDAQRPYEMHPVLVDLRDAVTCMKTMITSCIGTSDTEREHSLIVKLRKIYTEYIVKNRESASGTIKNLFTTRKSRSTYQIVKRVAVMLTLVLGISAAIGLPVIGVPGLWLGQMIAQMTAVLPLPTALVAHLVPFSSMPLFLILLSTGLVEFVFQVYGRIRGEGKLTKEELQQEIVKRVNFLEKEEEFLKAQSRLGDKINVEVINSEAPGLLEYIQSVQGRVLADDEELGISQILALIDIQRSSINSEVMGEDVSESKLERMLYDIRAKEREQIVQEAGAKLRQIPIPIINRIPVLGPIVVKVINWFFNLPSIMFSYAGRYFWGGMATEYFGKVHVLSMAAGFSVISKYSDSNDGAQSLKAVKPFESFRGKGITQIPKTLWIDIKILFSNIKPWVQNIKIRVSNLLWRWSLFRTVAGVWSENVFLRGLSELLTKRMHTWILGSLGTGLLLNLPLITLEMSVLGPWIPGQIAIPLGFAGRLAGPETSKLLIINTSVRKMASSFFLAFSMSLPAYARAAANAPKALKALGVEVKDIWKSRRQEPTSQRRIARWWQRSILGAMIRTIGLFVFSIPWRIFKGLIKLVVVPTWNIWSADIQMQMGMNAVDWTGNVYLQRSARLVDGGYGITGLGARVGSFFEALLGTRLASLTYFGRIPENMPEVIQDKDGKWYMNGREVREADMDDFEDLLAEGLSDNLGRDIDADDVDTEQERLDLFEEMASDDRSDREFWQDLFGEYPEFVPLSVVLNLKTLDALREGGDANGWQVFPLDDLFNGLRVHPEVLYQGLYELSQLSDEEQLEFSRQFQTLKPGTRQQVWNEYYHRLRGDKEFLERADMITSLMSVQEYQELEIQSESLHNLYENMAWMANRFWPAYAQRMIDEGLITQQELESRISENRKTGVPIWDLLRDELMDNNPGMTQDEARAEINRLRASTLPEGPLSDRPVIAFTQTEFEEELYNAIWDAIKEEGASPVMPTKESVNASEVASLIDYWPDFDAGVSFYEGNKGYELLQWFESNTDPSNSAGHMVTQEELIREAVKLHTEGNETDLFGTFATIGHFTKAMARRPDIIDGGPETRGEEGFTYLLNRSFAGLFIPAIDARNKAICDEYGMPVTWVYRDIDADGNDSIPDGMNIGIGWVTWEDVYYHLWGFILTSYYIEQKTFDEVDLDRLDYTKRLDRTKYDNILYYLRSYLSGYEPQTFDTPNLPSLYKLFGDFAMLLASFGAGDKISNDEIGQVIVANVARRLSKDEEIVLRQQEVPITNQTGTSILTNEKVLDALLEEPGEIIIRTKDDDEIISQIEKDKEISPSADTKYSLANRVVVGTIVGAAVGLALGIAFNHLGLGLAGLGLGFLPFLIQIFNILMAKSKIYDRSLGPVDLDYLARKQINESYVKTNNPSVNIDVQLINENTYDPARYEVRDGKYVVLLNERLVTRMPMWQIRLIIAHELRHISQDVQAQKNMLGEVRARVLPWTNVINQGLESLENSIKSDMPVDDIFMREQISFVTGEINRMNRDMRVMYDQLASRGADTLIAAIANDFRDNVFNPVQEIMSNTNVRALSENGKALAEFHRVVYEGINKHRELVATLNLSDIEVYALKRTWIQHMWIEFTVSLGDIFAMLPSVLKSMGGFRNLDAKTAAISARMGAEKAIQKARETVLSHRIARTGTESLLGLQNEGWLEGYGLGNAVYLMNCFDIDLNQDISNNPDIGFLNEISNGGGIGIGIATITEARAGALGLKELTARGSNQSLHIVDHNGKPLKVWVMNANPSSSRPGLIYCVEEPAEYSQVKVMPEQITEKEKMEKLIFSQASYQLAKHNVEEGKTVGQVIAEEMFGVVATFGRQRYVRFNNHFVDVKGFGHLVPGTDIGVDFGEAQSLIDRGDESMGVIIANPDAAGNAQNAQRIWREIAEGRVSVQLDAGERAKPQGLAGKLHSSLVKQSQDAVAVNESETNIKDDVTLSDVFMEEGPKGLLERAREVWGFVSRVVLVGVYRSSLLLNAESLGVQDLSGDRGARVQAMRRATIVAQHDEGFQEFKNKYLGLPRDSAVRRRMEFEVQEEAFRLLGISSEIERNKAEKGLIDGFSRGEKFALEYVYYTQYLAYTKLQGQLKSEEDQARINSVDEFVVRDVLDFDILMHIVQRSRELGNKGIKIDLSVIGSRDEIYSKLKLQAAGEPEQAVNEYFEQLSARFDEFVNELKSAGIPGDFDVTIELSETLSLMGKGRVVRDAGFDVGMAWDISPDNAPRVTGDVTYLRVTLPDDWSADSMSLDDLKKAIKLAYESGVRVVEFDNRVIDVYQKDTHTATPWEKIVSDIKKKAAEDNKKEKMRSYRQGLHLYDNARKPDLNLESAEFKALWASVRDFDFDEGELEVKKAMFNALMDAFSALTQVAESDEELVLFRDSVAQYQQMLGAAERLANMQERSDAVISSIDNCVRYMKGVLVSAAGEELARDMMFDLGDEVWQAYVIVKLNMLGDERGIPKDNADAYGKYIGKRYNSRDLLAVCREVIETGRVNDTAVLVNNGVTGEFDLASGRNIYEVLAGMMFNFEIYERRLPEFLDNLQRGLEFGVNVGGSMAITAAG
ncbi:MAG: aspartate/glutamate racemase family protein [Endomicrobiales bacterium]|nr:aspartate/glutamate racemase family protein [Endomicrobiales bacterium]